MGALFVTLCLYATYAAPVEADSADVPVDQGQYHTDETAKEGR